MTPGQAVEYDRLTRSVVLSSIGAAVLLQLLLVLVTGLGRKPLLDALDTAVASFLLLCLVLLVLGLPLGASLCSGAQALSALSALR